MWRARFDSSDPHLTQLTPNMPRNARLKLDESVKHRSCAIEAID